MKAIESTTTLLLEAAHEVGPENILTLENVKAWLAELLRMHDEEIEQFPTEKYLPYRDLLVVDRTMIEGIESFYPTIAEAIEEAIPEEWTIATMDGIFMPTAAHILVNMSAKPTASR